MQRRPVAKDLDHHHRYHRNWADPRKEVAATYASGDYTKEIADHSDVHNSTVSRAVKHSEKTG